jgi:hypothetical protein
MTVNLTSAAPGQSLTVTVTGATGGNLDWLALALSSASDTSYLRYIYLATGQSTQTWTVPAPNTPGTYEFRLFLNNSYSRAATSPPVTVAP